MAQSKFKGLVEAKMLESKQASKLASYQASKLASKQDNKLVGIVVRVEEDLRIYWNAQAKLQRTSLAAEVRRFLLERFGKP